jgi:phosphate transport system substrate-binding protein
MRLSGRLLYGAAVLVAVSAAACGSSNSGGSSSSSTGSSSSGAAPTTAATTAATAAGSAVAAPPFSCVTGTITAAGSTAIQPLADAASKMYVQKCQGATVTVQGGGSGTGLSQVSQGAVQIGNSDIKTEDQTPPITGLVDHVAGHQGFAMVTNKDVTVKNLTQQQATDIFTCKTTNWSAVGGPNEPIVVVLRPQSSGTRTTFRNLVMNGQPECQTATTLTEDSNGAVRQAIEGTKGAISVIGFAYFADPSAQAALNIMSYNGVQPTVQNIGNGSYKIASDINMYTKGEATGLTKAFLDYMLSDDVQHQLIPSLDYGPIR